MTDVTAPDRSEDLATRPVGRLLLWAGTQTTLSVGVYGVYALTNAWFVARGVGETALAAVNLVAPLLLLLGAVATTVGVGGASLVSRGLGARDTDAAARAAGNAFVVYWVTAVVVTATGLVFLEPLLRLMGATDETLPDAQAYGAVIIGGAIFATGFSALVRAEGRMLFSTLLWVVPVVVQIVLDPILIFGFDLGVVGAGLGTVTGQAVSAAMAVWFFFVQRRRPYRIGLRHLRPRWTTVGALLSIGAPSFLLGIGATVLAVLVNALLAAAGTVVLAAYAVCTRVQTFVTMPQMGITQAVQPIVGFNAGRGLDARADRARTLALRATIGVGAAASAIVAIAAEPLASLFLSDPESVSMAAAALRVIAIGFVFSGVAPLISATFQALGRPAPSYAISIGTLVAVKAPLVLLLAPFGPIGVLVALPVGDAVSAALAWVVFRRNRVRSSALSSGAASSSVSSRRP
ncbi:putative efflux protein, MATE family [Agromyces sp. CF514]|uniref:MATE family efflux transporter n=1 Tax=Agromyces sp. CF514 TaxID=1881031 RepID=UPI0008F37E4D|nr:MATE family efflux transporter [Agromyces sp. CF514]SFR67550.1 putative efflux protein, MATE family [Agromyces sp. CF514]